MDKMNKILYVILTLFFGWLMKLLSDRIVPGIVELILCFLGIGFLIQLIFGFCPLLDLDDGEKIGGLHPLGTDIVPQIGHLFSLLVSLLICRDFIVPHRRRQHKANVGKSHFLLWIM